MACARHVHGMLTACSRHAHGMLTACSRHAYAWHVRVRSSPTPPTLPTPRHATPPLANLGQARRSSTRAHLPSSSTCYSTAVSTSTRATVSSSAHTPRTTWTVWCWWMAPVRPTRLCRRCRSACFPCPVPSRSASPRWRPTTAVSCWWVAAPRPSYCCRCSTPRTTRRPSCP